MKPLDPVLRGGPLLIAHRGGGGLVPENTMTAFRQAAAVWHADMIELDVQASADGYGVVIHDATVDRTTNGRGAVADLTLAELQALDAGYRFSPDHGRTFPFRGQGVRIPTIDEVLTALPAMRFTVEVKAAAAQRPFFAAVAQAQAADRVIAAGEHDAFRTEFHGYAGCTSASIEEGRSFYILHRLRLARLSRIRDNVAQFSEFHGRRRVVSARLIRELRARNIPVHVWTINETSDMHRLLDWGADGLVTDRPDRLARVLHERLGRPLPPGLSSPSISPSTANAPA